MNIPSHTETGSGEDLYGILDSARRIAIIGCSDNPLRPSNRIARYLLSVGYAVTPVNPHCANVEGIPCVASIHDVPADADPDIVVVIIYGGFHSVVKREA